MEQRPRLHQLVAVLEAPAPERYIEGGGVRVGDVGTVVDQPAAGGVIVEFVDQDGKVTGLCEMDLSQVLPLNVPTFSAPS